MSSSFPLPYPTPLRKGYVSLAFQALFVEMGKQFYFVAPNGIDIILFSGYNISGKCDSRNLPLSCK